MKTNITKHIVLFAFATGLLTPLAHATKTANYYKCTHREGGEYNYGRAPNVCDASAFGDDKTVYQDYAQNVFDDSKSRSSERSRYTQSTYALIRDAAKYYLKKRKPSASADEVTQWTLAIELVAAHESRMSHYRHTSDTRLKLMRGDLGHGHGLMQVDDRSHFSAINQGLAWNLITNLTYAMDIYYAQWERAPSQSCVGKSTNWSARIRAAWAAYNGGPGSICRWTNPKSTYAQNDKNFLDMYNSRNWRAFVVNESAPSPVDVACLIENRENCPIPGLEPSPGTPAALKVGVLYKLENQSVCTLVGTSLKCVADPRDAVCLNAITKLSSQNSEALSKAVSSQFAQGLLDRHALCTQLDSSLIDVGHFLHTESIINMRSTPGGQLLVAVPQGQKAQVLDFELRNYPTNDRYYQIQVGSTKGYIYAGDVLDHERWATLVSGSNLPSTVAQAGQKITVVTPSGINLRATPGGKLVLAIAKGTVLSVSQTVVQGANNEIYYKVSHGGHTGYIYSGSLLPVDTIGQWTRVSP